MISECLHSLNYFQRTILRQHSASKFTYELALLFTVFLCQLRDSFVILSQAVFTCQQLFLFFYKSFFPLRSLLETYIGCGFLLYLLLFPVVLTTLLSYQSFSFFASLIFHFFYFCDFGYYFQYFICHFSSFVQPKD